MPACRIQTGRGNDGIRPRKLTRGNGGTMPLPGPGSCGFQPPFSDCSGCPASIPGVATDGERKGRSHAAVDHRAGPSRRSRDLGARLRRSQPSLGLRARNRPSVKCAGSVRRSSRTRASPDRTKQVLDLRDAGGPRVCLGARPFDGRRGDLSELVFRHAEVAQPLEPSEPGELLHPTCGVVGP